MPDAPQSVRTRIGVALPLIVLAVGGAIASWLATTRNGEETKATVPAAQDEQPSTITARPYEKVVIHSTATAPGGFDVATIDWKVDKPASGEEFDSGTAFGVWAPPGRYEVESEITFVNWDARKFQKVERVYTVHVQGAQPPPEPLPNPDPKPQPTPNPEPQPNPTPPKLIGLVYSVVIREAPKLTGEETEALSQIRSWVDQQDHDKVVHLEFAPDAELADGSPHPAVAAYVKSMSHGAKMPYGFITQSREGYNGAHIHWHGELEDAQAHIDRLKGLLK